MRAVPPTVCAALVAITGLVPSPATGTPAAPATRYEDRWVYCSYNLQVEKNADEVVKLIDRAAKAGYTAVVLADYKFNVLGRVPDSYFKHVARVKKAAEAAGLELIPAVFPVGYSNGLLAHDPNLAAGLPVKDAPFVVKDGKLVPAGPPAALQNGDFEQAEGDRLLRFNFQDGVGQSTFVDRQVAASGKQSLRMQETSENCRVQQKVKVRPYSCYRLSAKVKTKGFRAGDFKLLVLGEKGRPLTFHQGHPKPEQDWAEMEVVFNSLEAGEVGVYVGAWGGLKGTVWIDDLRLEELALVNVLRREACPLTVTSEDGKTAYEEGKDFEPVKDPKLGTDPYAGEFRFDHPGPAVTPTPNSRIRNGDKLLVSWYHPVIIQGEQVCCGLTDPKVFELLSDQAKRVNDLLRPRTWFMSHDEIRAAGWDAAEVKSGKTPGQQLAENVRRCVGLIRGLDPKARVVVWSDMFDPFHNAVDNYYLVNGSLKGSWEGLPKDVVIANWNGAKSAESLKFFAGRGHRQVIAGYYDGDIGNFRRWDAAAKGVPGVSGFMYTTWQARYGDLEEFGKALSGK